MCGEVSDLARNLLKGTKYEIASRRIMFPEIAYPSPDTQGKMQNVMDDGLRRFQLELDIALFTIPTHAVTLLSSHISSPPPL